MKKGCRYLRQAPRLTGSNGMGKTKELQERPVRGQLLNIDEGRNYVRMGRTTFYDCLKKGEIPYFHPPRGKILVDTADLDEWLDKAKIPASKTLGKI